MDPTICFVKKELPTAIEQLRCDAKKEGSRIIQRLLDEWADGTHRFDQEGEALCYAEFDGMIAGLGGLTIDPVHSEALRMRRFYIRPLFRKLGVARAIAEAIQNHASQYKREFTVHAGTPDAPMFWDAMGYERVTNRNGITHRLAFREKA